MVSRWRDKLNDRKSPFLWSTEELVAYANTAIEEICRECDVLYDKTTASVCEVTMVQDQAVYSVSPLITRIDRAKLSTQALPIPVVGTKWMDENRYDWENASSGSPSLIVDDGVGTDKIQVYPPPDAATDAATLTLGVYRLPVTELDPNNLSATTELPINFQKYIDAGVYREAYGKDDVDTNDEDMELKWARKFEDNIEAIKMALIRKRYADLAVVPLYGNS